MLYTRKFTLFLIVTILSYLIVLQNYTSGSKADNGGLKDCSCGREIDELSLTDRIMGGSVMGERNHPFMALITYKEFIVCGGSVVGPYHVLTAAHCIMDILSKDRLQVVLGVHDRIMMEKHAKVFAVRNIITHENFQVLEGNLLVNDIALLELDKIDFNDYIQPICLPFNFDVSRYRAAVVAGWGKTQYKGATSRLPRHTVLSLLTTEECKKSKVQRALGVVPNIYNDVMCAYKRESDACQGDSGGPLYFKNNDDLTFQIGIVSFGVNCGTWGMPGIYTRVTNYLQWLRNKLNGSYCSVPL